MAIPTGHQWLHVTMRRRLVEALDKARGQASREEYLARLVEADVSATRTASAQPLLASSTSTGPSVVSAHACGTDNPPGYVAPAPRQRTADHTVAEAVAGDEGDGAG